MVEDYARVMLREERHLLPPRQMIPSRPMSEHHGWPAAVGLVIDIRAIYACEGHTCPRGFDRDYGVGRERS